MPKGCGFCKFVLGGIVGLIAGLAYAPRPGEDTRKRWKEKREDLKERAEELKLKAQDLLEKVEEAWMSTEEWREHARERTVELKGQAQELSRKATSEAENLSEGLKTRFADLKSRLQGIQEDLKEVDLEKGDVRGKAQVALQSLKERLHIAKDGFSEAMKAKEEELKDRIDEVVEADREKKEAKAAPKKKTAASKKKKPSKATESDADEEA
jgi:gas vesicle protein